MQLTLITALLLHSMKSFCAHRTDIIDRQMADLGCVQLFGRKSKSVCASLSLARSSVFLLRELHAVVH